MKIICLFEFTISVKSSLNCVQSYLKVFIYPPILLNNIKYITFSYIKNK